MTSPKGESPTGISSTVFPSSQSRQKVLLIFGTRPEAVKLCPLVTALRQIESLQTHVCVTAQHRAMLDQVLDTFQVSPDYDLDVMKPGQNLTSLTSRILAALEPVLSNLKPDIAVVQGDTTTTLCGALASFYAGIPVAHVEAGLRTFDLQAPFPEEMNRSVTTQLTALHFAPTQWSADNLTRVNVPADRIHITGNTGIDAVLEVQSALERGQLSGLSLPFDPSKKLVVITAHRRESFGEGFVHICNAVATLAERGDVQIIWPVHPNPQVQKIARTMLAGKSNVLLIEPLEYVQFVDLMRRAFLIVTDSGGIQEEGPSLGKPILVLRDKTERPEGVEAGTVKLVGSNTQRIVQEANLLLDDHSEYLRMAQTKNPYGDGHASVRIAEYIAAFLGASHQSRANGTWGSVSRPLP